MSVRKRNINYEELTKQIFVEHNKIRTDPSSYIEIVEGQMKFFRGDILSRPGENPIQTSEGKTAYQEAIEFLKRQKPVPELKLDANLSKASQDHVNDIGPKGVASHDSHDGKNVSDRIERYCEWDTSCCENIDFGCFTAVDVILTFLIDDGIKDRNHRKNIFNPNLLFMGVASGKHEAYEHVTVCDYVAGVRELGEESPDLKKSIFELAPKKSEDGKKNPFQEEDVDAPDNTVSVRLVKTTKVIKGKPRKITKKIYLLDDGSQHIVEIEDADLLKK